MKIALNVLLICIISATACNSSKEREDKNFISIVSFIKKQVDHIDSSLYSITKVVITDTLQGDTTFLPRENFRKEAKEFLEIPDLSVKKVAKRYKEEPARYDELLGRVIISYTTITPKKEEYTKQELLVIPNVAEGDKVNTIIVTRVYREDDTEIQKNLLWQIDKSFQITTTSQKKGEQATTAITKVFWTEDGTE